MNNYNFRKSYMGKLEGDYEVARDFLQGSMNKIIMDFMDDHAEITTLCINQLVESLRN